MRRSRLMVLIGLGVFAGAVLPSKGMAQVLVSRDTLPGRRDTIPARRDSTPARPDSTQTPHVPLPPARDTLRLPLPAGADSMIRNDSIALGILGEKERRTADTLKAPLPRPESPPALEIGAARVYDRAAIFATGAVTLSDLLGRVPGLTSFATGWLLAPTGVASQGDFRHVRIFLDGLELDAMDRREQGRAPVNDLRLHTLEEVRIERGAEEVRVYARSWRVASTTPATRADVLTGDQGSNLYRGYFGRRYAGGQALQVTAEQLSTQPLAQLSSSDSRSFMLRYGMVRGPWSADVTGLRGEVARELWLGQGDQTQTLDTIAPWSTRRTTVYLRLANGDPDAPRWGQVVLSSHAFTGSPSLEPIDSLSVRDSTTYENQYLFTGGLRRGPARVSIAERIRTSNHETSAVPSVRASLETSLLALSVLAEGKSPLAPARVEATARASFLDRLSLLASVSRTGGGVFGRVIGSAGSIPVLRADGSFSDLPLGPVVYDSASVPRYELLARTNTRAEAGIRLLDLWLSAGLMRRGATTLLPAAGLGSDYAGATAVRMEGSATARTAAIRGRLFRAINIDAWALAWTDTAGLYRPKYQTRTELYLQSNLLDRFPHGNFGILTSLAHEYRSSTRFATASDSLRTAAGFRTLDFKLEIRVQSATVSYQFRNLLQERYASVPGFFIPRQTQFYGVRWDFWN